MSNWQKGIFNNGMAWASIGDGEKIAIFIPGGPGNPPPVTGRLGNTMMKPFRGLMDAGYRIVTVTRKRNMPKGYSVEDIAGDYAEMIKAEFNGHADLLLGSSYGGMIGQFIAANHPETFKAYVIMVAGYMINPDAQPIDHAFAKALSEGRTFRAGWEIAPALFPSWKPLFVARLIGGLMSRLGGSGVPHEHFANDVMVEVESEPGFNARHVLHKITTPVLIIAGDQDFYFSESVVRETHALIPNSQLKMYEGKGHLGAAMDKRIGPDIIEFLTQTAKVEL